MPELWNEHYPPIIDRMASWFHLLPASREHHPVGAGGLLTHSPETTNAAAGLFDRVIVAQSLTQSERYRYPTVLRWAAIVGAMLHDCAKPMTDLSVTIEHSGSVWNPVQGSLVGWAEQAEGNSYRIRWRPNRAGLHRMVLFKLRTCLPDQMPVLPVPRQSYFLVGTDGQKMAVFGNISRIGPDRRPKIRADGQDMAEIGPPVPTLACSASRSGSAPASATSIDPIFGTPTPEAAVYGASRLFSTSKRNFNTGSPAFRVNFRDQ